MDLPGFRLHGLHGELREHNAVSVSANRRVPFRFDDGNAVKVHCLDDHKGDLTWPCTARHTPAQ